MTTITKIYTLGSRLEPSRLVAADIKGESKMFDKTAYQTQIKRMTDGDLLSTMQRTTQRLTRLYSDFNDKELKAVMPQHRINDIEDAIDTAERELAIVQKEAYNRFRHTKRLIGLPFAEEWEGRLKLYLRRGRWIIEYGQVGLTLRDAETLRSELRKVIDWAYEIQDEEWNDEPSPMTPLDIS